jgi:hypothetical protein
MLAKAEHLCRIGEKAVAVAAYKAVLEKTVAIGQKIDAAFTLVRIGKWQFVSAFRILGCMFPGPSNIPCRCL